ncbi:MAG TPA: glucosaminidase domain-containing protein [Paludibacteraceae bacterium]|nr:glucosaminidase domain-containing protein [Paludibacteraceae bacterium]
MRNLKWISLLMALFTNVAVVFSQSYRSQETIDYIEKYYKVAIREMYKYHIPASITLAQGILESGSGRSDLSEKANNHFGIKCTSDYTGDKFFKDDNIKNDCFRVYEHADGSYRDHSLFLTTRAHYASLFKLDITDYKGWAKGLKKAGYATNPKYPDLLIAVIEQNQLYEYDKNPEKYISKSEAESYTLDGNESTPKDNTVIAPNNQEGARSNINGVKCVLIKPGDTFYALSKRYGMTVEKLQKLNDFPSWYVLKVGEYVFLEKKKKKNTSVKVHEVKASESVLSISQKYGVRKKSLMKRNKLKSEDLTVGQKLMLY